MRQVWPSDSVWPTVPTLLRRPARSATTPASAEDGTMINLLLTGLCAAVLVVLFVFGWAAIVIGARYDEHNWH